MTTPPTSTSGCAAAPGSPVAVLFARADSIYKTMPGCDVWDIERDARQYRGGMPIVAHPPCRAWGVLRHMAKPRVGERELALWAVCMVRIWGGVIEHPAGSLLWREAALPEPGQRDGWGGWTLQAPQYWWGHRCEKETRFYVAGCEPAAAPTIPMRMGHPTHVITQGLRMGEPGWRPRVPNWEREATPPDLAAWLVELARKCKGNTSSTDTVYAAHSSPHAAF